MDLQDKQSWCEHGRNLEDIFIEEFGEELSLEINKNKSESVYVIDMFNTKYGVLSDLKSQNTPFFLAGKKYNIDPQFAVVFNKKDKLNYIKKTADGSELYIYFWVKWDAQDRFGVKVESIDSIYATRFSNLLKILDEDKLHEYKQRKGDTRGNAKESYVIDVRAMKLLIKN
jgi:hypothetical protein|tara:strand:- start:878 stop:1390 length:513 start_codon:yes stop_codon:yes gene_type:complete